MRIDSNEIETFELYTPRIQRPIIQTFPTGSSHLTTTTDTDPLKPPGTARNPRTTWGIHRQMHRTPSVSAHSGMDHRSLCTGGPRQRRLRRRTQRAFPTPMLGAPADGGPRRLRRRRAPDSWWPGCLADARELGGGPLPIMAPPNGGGGKRTRRRGGKRGTILG